MPITHYDLLLFGGRRDPNINCLQKTARDMGKQVLMVSHDESSEPSIAWNFSQGQMIIDQQAITAQSAFLRYDVFSSSNQSSEELDRAYAWFSVFTGACSATQSMLVPNERMDSRASHKAFILAYAASHGIPIPESLISNDQLAIEAFCQKNDAIAKPAAGGAYCIKADKACEETDWQEKLAPMPAIIQETLTYPEYRIFRYGDNFMTFEIHSEHLDYRPHQTNSIRVVPNSVLGEGIVDRLKSMSDSLNINFFACDFKTHEKTGVPLFLELNSGPMFAAFSASSKGALAREMINWLTS
ncbi:MAG: hypothetical protein ACRBHB_20740 [Arenicella sp.]